ncbi:MAG: caspase family protein [Humidesulfovibrio sp.]|uniref:caspase family protein n=1 Tax=Humidesulfovibrio sp. TaxID=2910988 RepID=UPI0027F7DDA1|nr:caspase family protein [Humidesulfovibrio sp.]MDQ7833811.1 caspase family protein [Humidesulfovibrio sp.]
MRTATRLILALAALILLTTTAFAAPGRYALVIGNSAYKNKPLKNPANDAKDMARTLERLGFDVQLKTDVSLRDMEEAIRLFGERLKRGGVGLFYYAGHGVQVQGVNYLVPVNSNVSSESDAKFECVDAGRVLGKMEDAGNELNIVILDACRNNPFTRSFRSAEQGLARMDAPTGSIVAYATAPNSVASDGKGTNGLYTKYLLQNITTPGIPIEEVFKRVRIGVMSETGKKQVPWESSSIAGYFYVAGQPQQPLAINASQASLQQRQQEQRLKEYLAGLEAEKRQVEQERAELARRRQQLDQEAAKKLAEAQAPQDKRLREQLAVLEAERRKLEQERMALEGARREAERMQAEQAAKAKQKASSVMVAGPGAGSVSVVGQQASVNVPKPWQAPQTPSPQPTQQQRPRVEDRAQVLNRLAGVWRIETQGPRNYPMLQLKPGGDTLYGTLVGEPRLVNRMELSGLAVEDGNLHVRLDIRRPPEEPFEPARLLRDLLNGQGQRRPGARRNQDSVDSQGGTRGTALVRTIECVGDLEGSKGAEIPLVCERVDAEARSQGNPRKEMGRMVRTDGLRGY